MNQIEAYWLGFLCADGHLMKLDSRGRHLHRRMMLELQIRDIKHVNRFLSDFSPGRVANVRSKSLDNKIFQSAMTTISCNKLGFVDYNNFDDFKNGDSCLLGKLSDEEFRHWVRGFVDGDGSISYFQINCRRRPTPVLMAVSKHKKNLEYISSRVASLTGISSNTIKRSKSIYRMMWSGTRARDIMRWMYNSASRCLDRKYMVFEQCDQFESMFEIAGI
jgi:hypothetical protein